MRNPFNQEIIEIKRGLPKPDYGNNGDLSLNISDKGIGLRELQNQLTSLRRAVRAEEAECEKVHLLHQSSVARAEGLRECLDVAREEIEAHALVERTPATPSSTMGSWVEAEDARQEINQIRERCIIAETDALLHCPSCHNTGLVEHIFRAVVC